MKNVLIVGTNSFIGNHVQNRFEIVHGDEVKVIQLDSTTDEWKTYDYSKVDAIIHVAAIVHRPNLKDWGLYMQVNVDLPVGIAKKAKQAGVRQFVFLSTMSVFDGIGRGLKNTVIYETTPTNPVSMYGKSKLMAEQKLKDLEDASFKITIVRPPNVYGKNSRGNYVPRYVAMANSLPFVPKAYEEVRQSMIYVVNLAEFIRLSVERGLSGTFMPQDDKSVSSVELLQCIARAKGKRLRASSLLGKIVPFFSFIPIIKKAYGGLEYDYTLSQACGFNYVIIPFEKGIRETVS